MEVLPVNERSTCSLERGNSMYKVREKRKGISCLGNCKNALCVKALSHAEDQQALMMEREKRSDHEASYVMWFENRNAYIEGI